ncbi:response regulator transcription factor [Microcystis sp. LE19-195.1E]|jgi:DNA-binding NarL/FixJ family response regulator|uniref:response regulator transcription factor n=1 Tax=Microcystis sp. LE19-195.1E TaxID=3016440 RepID=UPI0022C9318A|nr:response regulator transcription factor [Microcystis sp. LE19-195.1E]MCZ8250545.1 response regulator transcription factor [Microcystis sp. LE19-195.1E]
MKETNKDNKQLLLIDDDPNLILLVKDYLEFRGYRVTTAENGREALEILERGANTAKAREMPDMIICDLIMPEMDGHTFLEKIRRDSRFSGIPVIFLSPEGQSQDKITGLTADVYMVKPFEPEELVALVESSLKQAGRLLKRSTRIHCEDVTPVQVPGNVELTPTELKVVQLVAQGLANREIAEKLNVSQRTIESHVSNMLHKTGLHNRTELAQWAIKSNKLLTI